MTRNKASGDIGDSDKSIMIATIYTMVQGTEFEGLFTTDWCWHIFCNSYLETLVFTVISYHDDCRSEWLVFNNINQWIDGAK